MEYSWVFLLIVAFHIGRIYFNKIKFENEEKEAEDQFEKNRKAELKKLITEREVRINKTEFDEDKFWIIVEKINQKCNNDYKKFNGLIRDKINSLNANEIVQLDNLINRLFFDRYSYDLLYTSYIILKKVDLDGMMLLMSIFLSKGEVFFKNACINTNLCLGKEINFNKDERIIFDLTAEAYAIKKNKFIPLPKPKDIILKGESTEENEIPIKYSELWNEFF